MNSSELNEYNNTSTTVSIDSRSLASTFTDYGLAIAAIILFMVGVSGNVTAIAAYVASPRLRCPQNLFVINLAVADCVTLFCAPIVITNSLTDTLVKPPFACYAVVIFLRLTTVMGMVTISAIGRITVCGDLAIVYVYFIKQ